MNENFDKNPTQHTKGETGTCASSFTRVQEVKTFGPQFYFPAFVFNSASTERDAFVYLHFKRSRLLTAHVMSTGLSSISTMIEISSVSQTLSQEHLVSKYTLGQFRVTIVVQAVSFGFFHCLRSYATWGRGIGTKVDWDHLLCPKLI